MNKFKTPVSMVVTQEQYERDLKSQLESLGYKESGILNPYFSPHCYLVTNAYNENDIIDNYRYSNNKDIHNRYFIDHYNPELYLALAAMTEGDIPIVGEWVIGVNSSSVDRKYPSKVTSVKGDSFSVDGRSTDSPHQTSIYFTRKVTKEELIKHFNKKQNMKNNKVTRKDLEKIYDVACITWKPKIKEITGLYIDPFKDEGELPSEVIKVMFEAATAHQKPVLESIFGKENKNPFIRKFKYDDISETSKLLFEDANLLQIASSAAESIEREDLIGRALYVNVDYNVILHQVEHGGKVIEIQKNENNTPIF